MSDEPKSLAHPFWPYTGTPWEWRVEKPKPPRELLPGEAEVDAWVASLGDKCPRK